MLLRDNRPFLRLVSAYVMNGMANGLPASLFTLFVAHVLAAREWTGVLLLAYFLAGVAALPAWLWFSRRVDKHRAWAVSMLWNCLVFAWVPFLGAGDTWLFLAICVLSGVSVAVALAVGIAFPALEWLGFDATQAANGEGTLALALCYGGLPILFKLGATALVWNFPHDRAAHASTRERVHGLEAAETPS